MGSPLGSVSYGEDRIRDSSDIVEAVCEEEREHDVGEDPEPESKLKTEEASRLLEGDKEDMMER